MKPCIICVRFPLLFELTSLTVRDLDESELLAGMPVGIQLVARRHEEEALLAMGEILDGALRSL